MQETIQEPRYSHRSLKTPLAILDSGVVLLSSRTDRLRGPERVDDLIQEGGMRGDSAYGSSARHLDRLSDLLAGVSFTTASTESYMWRRAVDLS